MTTMSEWAHEHWLLTFILAVFAIETIRLILSRTYRMIMVLCRGWPHAPNMDADGDIVVK